MPEVTKSWNVWSCVHSFYFWTNGLLEGHFEPDRVTDLLILVNTTFTNVKPAAANSFIILILL